ncbi:alpha/beta hydrolase [Marinomonas transparens]|uniref:Alpha/beta hydrolase n=1 Tax=Marinomonas transparens TaxID=2795388 RepID=A0A934JRK5_9GAMM|nr:alpha/beta hydrolase [Marinomonas transparens]MBJ7537077.1 alpha/beta hydrolase [Marinomonas transparens]
MLPQKAKEALNSWIATAAPVVAKVLNKSDVSWKDVRERYMSGLEALFPASEDVDYQTERMGSVDSLVCTPRNLSEQYRIILYIHGGGYVHGGVEAYKALTGHLAKKLSAKVYIPDYRQAPEHPFPVPIDDVYSAYKGLIKKGHNPKNISLIGDSAGGAMVVTIMRKARDAGLPLPSSGVAFSPWVDLTHSGRSAVTRDGVDPICNVEFLNKLGRLFLGDEIATHPDASPVYANVQGLSPILLQLGENEVMLSDALRLGTNLAEARVRTSIEIWPGMFHVWHLFAGILPESDQAIDSAVAFIKNHQIS